MNRNEVGFVHCFNSDEKFLPCEIRDVVRVIPNIRTEARAA
jgi:hypothetical protein